ncbi:hypothetical protein BU17DRAFT_25610, partial [Hysterangium stoloniferum]
RKYKDHTPTPSEHPSRPSFDALKQVIPGELKEPPKDQSALLRDGYQCMITHKYDFNSVRENEEVKKLITQFHEGILNTQCAHIFPSSTNANTSDSGGHGVGVRSYHHFTNTSNYISTNIERDLNDANIHHLKNIMTLEPIFHDWFDTVKV